MLNTGKTISVIPKPRKTATITKPNPVIIFENKFLFQSIVLFLHFSPFIIETKEEIIYCGENGIRTHDALLAHTHFPGVRLRPLGHLSREKYIILF